MRVLISGASIAGPVLAYWLTRYGHTVTVVERAAALRKTGGHAVDLFRPAVDISERMRVLPQIHTLATGTTVLTLHRANHTRVSRIDLSKLFSAASERHVEIMRDDLSEIYYNATRSDVEYVFGDSITAISDDGDVAFEHTAPRRFDVVVGADGLHSNVRQLTFGNDASMANIGGYLAVLSTPKQLAHAGESTAILGVNRVAAIYTAHHLEDARAVFLFRARAPLDYHHRDTERQKSLLRKAFDGMHPIVDTWLAELDGFGSFYFDSVTQLQMDTWSRGRVTLVGDAGYCPGPAVGGSTSLAVVGAYILAGELAAADGDHARAFARYERAMAEPVRNSRSFARAAAVTLIPRSRVAVWALANGGRLLSGLPAGVTRAVARLNTKGLRMHDSLPVPFYPEPAGDVARAD